MSKIDEQHFKNCRPCLLDTRTGRAESENSPRMQVVNRIWATTTQEERLAYHRVTCLNSRAPEDMALSAALADRVRQALSS